MTANALPGFSAATHGFPYPNSWERGMPVVEIPTPFGMIPIGDAAGGVCGGMVFAAADYYLLGQPIPPERTHDVFKYICKRLIDSWWLPFGVLRYYDWQRRPGGTRRWAGGIVTSGLTRLTILDEWPKIRAAIDAGLPAPLGLVKVYSWRPQDMARNHQVLAFGYEFDDAVVRLHCYDPNWPDHTSVLTIDARDPDADTTIEHSDEGGTVRGIFLTAYARPSGAHELPSAG